MKKYYIYAACILAVMWGCSSSPKESSNTEHAHEHNHDSGDHDHDHEGDNDHSHDGHNHEQGNGIALTTEQAKSIGLEIETVSPHKFHQVIKTSGQVVAAQGDERTIVATMNGVVSFSKAGANEGKSVRKGEALFSISSTHLADGDPTTRAKVAFQIAQREFERAESLIEDKLISQKDYSEIRLSYENAKIAYSALNSGGGGKGASMASPIAGFIKSKLVTEGQYVSMGDPLMVVTQNNKLQLKADISERHYKDLSSIRTANFKTPYDTYLYKLSDMGGQMLSYGKSANDTEYYIPVNFEFNNVGNVIAGSFVEVYLLSAERDNVITVPLSSLTEEQGIFFAYVQLAEEEYEKAEVKLGISDGDRVEVLSGLKDGDRVVTKGAFHVKLASASEAIPHGHSH